MDPQFQPPAYAWPDPDRDYANGDFIPGAAAAPASWAAKAEAFRQSLGARAVLNQPYGTGARHYFDLFEPETEAKGTLHFIHGGWWLAFGRETWSHLAAGALARGYRVVMPSYTLAPEARISAISREIKACCETVMARFSGPHLITGHSAGGHLAARMVSGDISLPFLRAVPVSPLTELGPLMALKANQKLGITPDEAESESPVRLRPRPGTSLHVHIGARERPSFFWQARTLAETWDCDWSLGEGHDHFTVVDQLTDPQSPLTKAVFDLG